MAVHTEISPAEAADRLAIRELFDAYAHCADRRDAEGQKALFTTGTRFAVYMSGPGTDPTYVGLCPDTAQFTVAGSDPIEIVARHRDRLVLTHWKDAVGPAPADVPIDETIWARQVQWFGEVGTGVVDWPAWVRLLRDLNYTGWAVFELDTAADPVANLKAIKRFVENTVGHIYL